MTRRELLYSSAASALTAKVSGAFSIGEVFAQSRAWDQGELVHVLPTVSHDRLLIKASFKTPLSSAPSLRIGASSFPGVQTDTHGECWRFDADDLKSATTYTLSLDRWVGVLANGASGTLISSVATASSRSISPSHIGSLGGSHNMIA